MPSLLQVEAAPLLRDTRFLAACMGPMLYACHASDPPSAPAHACGRSDTLLGTLAVRQEPLSPPCPGGTPYSAIKTKAPWDSPEAKNTSRLISGSKSEMLAGTTQTACSMRSDWGVQLSLCA